MISHRSTTRPSPTVLNTFTAVPRFAASKHHKQTDSSNEPFSSSSINSLVNPSHTLHKSHQQSHINTDVRSNNHIIHTRPHTMPRTDNELKHDAEYILSRQPTPKLYKKSLYTRSSLLPHTVSFYDANKSDISKPQQLLSIHKHHKYKKCSCQQQKTNTIDPNDILHISQSPTAYTYNRSQYTDITQYSELLDQLKHSEQKLVQLMNKIESNKQPKTVQPFDLIQQHNISVEHYSKQLLALQVALHNNTTQYGNNKHDIGEHKESNERRGSDELNVSYAEQINNTEMNPDSIDVTVEQINEPTDELYNTIEPIRSFEYSIDHTTPMKLIDNPPLLHSTSDKQLIKDLIASGTKIKHNHIIEYHINDTQSITQQLTYPSIDEIYS